MKVTKEKSKFGTIIRLEEGEKYITISFGGTLDLYWSITNTSKEVEDYHYDSFTITKENYSVYRLFEKLYYDIENINIFDIENSIPFYIDEEEEIEYLKRRKREIEERKEKYRLYNCSNYNELFDKDSKTITWYSDETAHKVSNILKIKKEENIFQIEFYTQPYIKGYDRDSHFLGHISIRFRNSGSSYDPFNVIFMRMYQDMHEIDDANDIGHQIHIEEYLYEKKVKKLTK